MSAGSIDPITGLSKACVTWTDASGVLQLMTFDVVVSETWSEPSTVTEHPVEDSANVADHVRVELVTCELKIRSTNEPLDSNNWGDPVLLPLPVTLPTAAQLPPTGVVVVPVWINNDDVRQFAAALVGQAVSASAPYPQGAVTGVQVGTLAGELIPGFEVDIPVPAALLGLGLGAAIPQPPAVAQTWQFPVGQDFVEATHAKLVQLKNAATLFTVLGSKQTFSNMVIDTLTFTREANTGTGEDITLGFKEVRIVSTQTVAAPIPNLPAGGGGASADQGDQSSEDAPAAMQSVALQGLNALGSVSGFGALFQ